MLDLTNWVVEGVGGTSGLKVTRWTGLEPGRVFGGEVGGEVFWGDFH